MGREIEDVVSVRAAACCSQGSITYNSRLKGTKRSRAGCRNCKLRSVKCDQSRPDCKRCLSYGVRCNFVAGVAELQLAASGTMHIIEPEYRSLPAVRHGPRSCREDALLGKFQTTVATTLSIGKRLALFQNEIVPLSDDCPSLKHTIIALTLMHDRQSMVWGTPGTFQSKSIPALSEQEIGHWAHATSGFHTDLKGALTSTTHRHLNIRQQAALLATSTLLAVLSFCYVEASTPTEAWPLAGRLSESSPEDLQWIKMSNGKMSTQTLTQGLATDPVFRYLVHTDDQDKSPLPRYEMTVSAVEYQSFQELEKFLDGPEVEALMRIVDSDCFITIIFSFWSFVGGMTVEFEDRMRRKKPSALLVLLYWYAKLNPMPVWWLKTRTTIEGQAICAYLYRYHEHEPGIKKLLRWPTSVLLGSV